jgi:hypothetical protein
MSILSRLKSWFAEPEINQERYVFWYKTLNTLTKAEEKRQEVYVSNFVYTDFSDTSFPKYNGKDMAKLRYEHTKQNPKRIVGELYADFVSIKECGYGLYVEGGRLL